MYYKFYVLKSLTSVIVEYLSELYEGEGIARILCAPPLHKFMF